MPWTLSFIWILTKHFTANHLVPICVIGHTNTWAIAFNVTTPFNWTIFLENGGSMPLQYSPVIPHIVTPYQHTPPLAPTSQKKWSLWKPKMSRMALPLHIHSSHSYFEWDFKYKEWHVHTQTWYVICQFPLRTHTLYLCGYFLHCVLTVNITQTGSVISTGASLLRVSEHHLTIYNGAHFSEGRTVNFQTKCMSQEWRSWTLGLQLIIFTSLGYSENVSKSDEYFKLHVLKIIFMLSITTET